MIDRDALGKVDSTSKFLQFTINPITADGKPISQNEAQKYMNGLEEQKTKLKGICLKIVRDNDEGLEKVIDRLRKENEKLKEEKDMWEKDAVGFRKNSNMLLDLILLILDFKVCLRTQM